MNKPLNFEDAFTLTVQNTAGATKFLADFDFGQTERKILTAYLKLKTSDFNWIFQNLESLKVGSDFVDGARCLVMGIGKNNSGDPLEALAWLEQAHVRLLSSTPIIRFLVLYNRFVAYQNLSEKEKLEDLFLESQKFDFADNPQFKTRQLRVRFNYDSIRGNVTSARQALEDLQALEGSMDEFQKLAWIIDKIRFFAAQEDYSSCQLEIEKLKRIRSFYLSADYNFIKAILGCLQANKPLYLYERDFATIPILAHQLGVLLGLEKKDLAEAGKSWAKLQELSSSVYREDFQYEGETCLFSLCLGKLLMGCKPKVSLSSGELISKEERLFTLLKEHPHGLSKSQLHHLLWGAEPTSKADLGKLSKLVERVKLKFGVEVKSRKGTYILSTPSPRRGVA
jgi:hypothetical protein